MNTELSSLVFVSAFTSVLWIPYVLNRMVVGGMDETVGYPSDPQPLSPWAQRLRAAHANAIENLVVFGALILSAQFVGVSSPATALAATLYLWSRIAHAIFYTLCVPWFRTLAFVVGFAAQMLIAWQLVAA